VIADLGVSLASHPGKRGKRGGYIALANDEEGILKDTGLISSTQLRKLLFPWRNRLVKSFV